MEKMSPIDVFSLLKPINDDNIFSAITEITAVCFQQQDIFLGTKSGTLFKLENQRLDDEEENSFITSLLDRIEISLSHEIQKIDSSTFLNLILVLSNETITFVNENPFSLHPIAGRLKSVVTFAVTEGVTVNEECATEICVGLTSKKLQLHLLSSDKLTLLKEVSLTSVPITLSFRHDVICVATSKSYNLVNISTDQITDLFSFQITKVKPIITCLPNNGGFLLHGPDGLGIFADVEGASQRPPIQWSSTVKDFVAWGAFIIAVDNEFITVHSINTQEQIQTLHFPNKTASIVSSISGLVIISNHSDHDWNLSQVAPLTWNQQAEQYLKKRNPNVAIEMAMKQLTKQNIDLNVKQKCWKIFGLAAFQKFAKMEFKEMKTLLEKGRVDLREVIVCYSDLLPRSYRFEPKIATVDSGFHLMNLIDNDIEKEKSYKVFLLELLMEYRDSSYVRHISQIVETALVKLYVELDPEKLFHNLTMMLSDVDFDDLVEYLALRGHHHASAMIMQWYGQQDKAVNVWSRLAKKEIVDPHFPGMSFLQEIMSNISDPKIVVKNIDWLLKMDPQSTTQTLIKLIDRFRNDRDLVNLMITDQVMEYIKHYPDTLFDIMYELAINGLLQKSSQHDNLANIFLMKLHDTQNDEEAFSKIREKFQEFLYVSEEYQALKILSQVRQFPVPLLIEEAFILGQTLDHQAALTIIVHKVHNFKLAEKYCTLFEKRNPSAGMNLFVELLKTYLKSSRSNPDNEYKLAALDLLDSQAFRFDLKEVLLLLPDDWPLNRLYSFLVNSVCVRRQTCFTVTMKRGLEKVRKWRQCTDTRAVIQKHKLTLDLYQDLICSHCGNNIENSSFIKTPAGLTLHKHCFNCT